MKSVFVSYKYEDKKWKDDLEKFAKDGRLGENVVITGETEDVRPNGTNAIRSHINPKITGATNVIVLVGNDTHNSSGVEREIQSAKSQQKKIIAIKIPGTMGAVPKSLGSQNLVPFEPNAIKKALENS
jgi:hypothetical protein